MSKALDNYANYLRNKAKKEWEESQKTRLDWVKYNAKINNAIRARAGG